MVGWTLWWALTPLWLLAALDQRPDHLDANDSLSGEWESIDPSSGGYVTRVQFGTGILRRVVSIQRGRYEIAGQKILLETEAAPGDAPIQETVPFRFECAGLVLEDSPEPRMLWPTPAMFKRAESPMVGRWNNTLTKLQPQGNRTGSSQLVVKTTFDSLTWEFRPDGTFLRETFTDRGSEGGIFQKQGSSIHIQFRYNSEPDHDEDWQIRTKARRLWITSGGKTLEYKHVQGFF